MLSVVLKGVLFLSLYVIHGIYTVNVIVFQFLLNLPASLE